MTSLNRDRVVTDFGKVKDLLAKSYTSVAWGRKVNVNTMFFNKEDSFLFLINLFKNIVFTFTFLPQAAKVKVFARRSFAFRKSVATLSRFSEVTVTPP